MSRSNVRSRTAGKIAIDRRVFMGSAVAACAVALTPRAALAAVSSDAVERVPGPLADWTIDDMWGVYPRYADAIGYGRPRTDVIVAAAPVDVAFVA